MSPLVRRLTTTRPGVVVLAVLVVLLVTALFGDKGVLHLWRLRGEIATLGREVQALEAENERLAQTIADLHDNPSTIERIAREELGLVRPGERVLRFPKSPRGGEATPGPPGGSTGAPAISPSKPPRSP